MNSPRRDARTNPATGLLQRARATARSVFGFDRGSTRAASLRRWGGEALLAAAAITAMLAVAMPATAQTTQVSNLAEDGERGGYPLSSSFANGFTIPTRDAASYYPLHSVDIDINKLAPESTWRPLSVQIWTATSAGVPLERIAFLERPETPEVGVNSFTAPAVLPQSPS